TPVAGAGAVRSLRQSADADGPARQHGARLAVRGPRFRRRSYPAAHHGGPLMAATTEGSVQIALEGARKSRRSLTKARIRWVIAALVVIFGAVAGRLIQLGL